MRKKYRKKERINNTGREREEGRGREKEREGEREGRREGGREGETDRQRGKKHHTVQQSSVVQGK